MAHHKASLRSIRHDAKVTAHRKSQTSRLRTYLRKARESLTGELSAAREVVRSAESVLARSAQHRLLHKKTAARLTSRLNKRLKAAALAAK